MGLPLFRILAPADAIAKPGRLVWEGSHAKAAGAHQRIYEIPEGNVSLTIWQGRLHEVSYRVPTDDEAEAVERKATLFAHYGNGHAFTTVADNGRVKTYRRTDGQRYAEWMPAQCYVAVGTIEFDAVRHRRAASRATADAPSEPPVPAEGEQVPKPPARRDGWWRCPKCRSFDLRTVDARVRKCRKCKHKWRVLHTKLSWFMKMVFLWAGVVLGILYAALGTIGPMLVVGAGGVFPRGSILCLVLGLSFSGTCWAAVRATRSGLRVRMPPK